ncbi:integrase catalytic domain-containing protein [Trichonephila clavipes]|uniref:Integrase catalytic domain-containing protein n=1 Tax=Trichonephila clavipes TaxID=2585209 RepID=A0A8X6RRM2_TRICX|nr:integrase catalytic domain-containing protein [Trichonephila clavipes]
MVELASNNFSAPVNQKKKEVNKPDKFSSAATLVNTHDKNGTGFVGIRSLSADIEKAFLQLGITPKHKDFLRFSYPDEGEEIVYRHCRVVFGVSSSPFLLAAVLAHLLENVPADDTQLGSKLKLSFYVDNCVTGVNDIAQQQEFILRSKEILSRGCFNLRNWESKHISKSTGTTKLLGIIWDLDKDTLKCKIDFESSGETKITKRLTLATVQKIFDPIGMLCSVTLTPKILLQNTWKLKLAWDSSLPEEIVKSFF